MTSPTQSLQTPPLTPLTARKTATEVQNDSIMKTGAISLYRKTKTTYLEVKLDSYTEKDSREKGSIVYVIDYLVVHEQTPKGTLTAYAGTNTTPIKTLVSRHQIFQTISSQSIDAQRGLYLRSDKAIAL